jgi:hypothetical protein
MKAFPYPPSFELRAVITRFQRPLGELTPPSEFLRALIPGEPPVAVWRAVTELLHRFGRRRSHSRRPGGERIGRAASRGRLGPINVAVDAANATALSSGLPVVVVDWVRLRGPLHIGATARPTRWVMDDRGNSLEVGGLPSVFEVTGPRVTPVAPDAAARTTAATRMAAELVGLLKPERGQ